MKQVSFLLFFFIIIFLKSTSAQDQRERVYNYPVLKPNHFQKPKVKGWATERIKETLYRGTTAFKTESGVYISWRLLETDTDNVAFDVFSIIPDNSKEKKLNQKPISKTTDFMVQKPDDKAWYFVKKIGLQKGDLEISEIIEAKTIENNLVETIKLKGNYIPDRIAVGDLNGDGKYDFVIKHPQGRVDPGVWRKSPETFKLEAYKHDGTFLWQKDLGWNIEQGIWYSPFIVYDFNGDGKAEVAVKTAPMSPDFRDSTGRVFSGPEYCSILEGDTGKEISKVDWPERSPRFGDYNRNSRHQMGMAYLDGKTPCLLICRGTYRLMIIDAWCMIGKKMEKLWRWDGDEENPVIRSQGAHSLHTVDLDDDGRDEIVLGSAVLDDNGTLLWSAGVGHSDKCFVTDIIPERPGMEVFFANEVWHDSLGVSMVDAKTGKPIWNIGHYTRHIGNGMVADILPEYPGLECFASEDGKAGLTDKYLFSAKGELISKNKDIPQCDNWIYWDSDKLRESIDFSKTEMTSSIHKYKGNICSSGIKGQILMIADLFGDWREELVTATPGEIHIYSTSIPANDRRVCLMQNPLYRSDVVHRSMGYPQAPVTSYYLGE